jgi:flagellar motility protein MotE (MotC chaperone)
MTNAPERMVVRPEHGTTPYDTPIWGASYIRADIAEAEKRAAVAEERERCAKIADEITRELRDGGDIYSSQDTEAVAAAIRGAAE